MNIIQIPFKVNPENISLMPQIMRRKDNNLPLKEAILVANFKFFVNPQIVALKMRPPSNGNPGIKLKTARAMLIIPR